ncbi:MAG: hypothetical protein NUV82_04310 [Candidatus Komeilibacteria bacterium]|nr:hypothetical protein [Candidatus Komeilibacteria bacterium]
MNKYHNSHNSTVIRAPWTPSRHGVNLYRQKVVNYPTEHRQVEPPRWAKIVRQFLF